MQPEKVSFAFGEDDKFFLLLILLLLLLYLKDAMNIRYYDV